MLQGEQSLTLEHWSLNKWEIAGVLCLYDKWGRVPGGALGGDLQELKGQVETRAAGRSYLEGHLEPEGAFCCADSRACPPLGTMSSHRRSSMIPPFININA